MRHTPHTVKSQGDVHFGMTSAWPLAMGLISRKANLDEGLPIDQPGSALFPLVRTHECSVSRSLLVGISPEDTISRYEGSNGKADAN